MSAVSAPVACPIASVATAPGAPAAVRLRTATSGDVAALFLLIGRHREAGRLLPRRLEELRVHAGRFIVATVGGDMAGCAELAPLSRAVAEVRSLVVDEPYRGVGLGGALVEEIKIRARRAGHLTLCAFTHEPRLFVRGGFSLVPHVWIPEKIATDCHTCPVFRRCGQQAMVFPLRPSGRQDLIGRTSTSVLPGARPTAPTRGPG